MFWAAGKTRRVIRIMKNYNLKPIFLQEPGDIVLEDSVMLSFFELTDKFNPLNNFKTISEMSRLIESAIFFDRMFVFDYKLDDDNTEAYYATENPLILADIINKLSSEKILNFVQAIPFEKYPQPSILLKQVKKSKIIPIKKIKSFNDFRFPYYLFQQEIARRSNCPFISSDNKYADYFIEGSQKYKNSLIEKLTHGINQKVSEQFKNILQSYHNIEIVIPPFLSIVLNNVVKGASFGEAILDLRNKFSKIRKLFSEYNLQFYNYSKPLKDQIKFANKIFSDIEKIARKFSIVEKTKYRIWSDSFDLILDSVSDIINFNVINSADLMSRLIKLSNDNLYELLLRYRYNSLFKIRNDFYQIKDYSNLLIKAVEPSIKESKKIFDKGFICVSPGNPFRTISGFEK